jgi:hypothetical protein
LTLRIFAILTLLTLAYQEIHNPYKPKCQNCENPKVSIT